MKKKTELMEAINAFEAKRKEAFETMKATPTEEAVQAYETVVKACNVLECQLADIESREKGVAIVESTEKKSELEETVAFVKGLREAVAIGNTYTGLIPTAIASRIQMKRTELSKLRNRCTVHPADGNYTITVEGTGATVAYVSEASAINDSTPTLGVVELGAYKLGALVKVSNEMLADVAVDVAAYLVDVIAKGFALKEDYEILHGTGSGAMTGVVPFVTTATGGHITLGAGTTAATCLTWAEVKSFIQSLGAYRSHACILMNPATVDIIHEFKDSGKYIFDQNNPLTAIWGLPIIATPDVDVIGSGKVIAIAGDFSYYHIADRKSVTITTLNELYAANDQVGVKAIQRIDGKPANVDAFAIYKCKTLT